MISCCKPGPAPACLQEVMNYLDEREDEGDLEYQEAIIRL
jgi:hypothetical protein